MWWQFRHRHTSYDGCPCSNSSADHNCCVDDSRAHDSRAHDDHCGTHNHGGTNSHGGTDHYDTPGNDKHYFCRSDRDMRSRRSTGRHLVSGQRLSGGGTVDVDLDRLLGKRRRTPLGLQYP